MPWDTSTPVWIWFVITLITTVWLWLIPPGKKLLAIVVWLNYTLIQSFFFLSVNWVMVNYYLRLLALFLCAALGWRFWQLLRRSPWLRGAKVHETIGLTFGLIFLAALGYLNARVLQSYDYKSAAERPLLALFPLRNGMYVIANGGNGMTGWGMNNHLHGWFDGESPENIHMAYGIDIFEMRIRGYLGKNLFPRANTDYEGFMEIVYSPCMGVVAYVEDGHPDVEPFAPVDTHLGNHVVIQCDVFYVTLGGLRNGSIMVKPGEWVSFNRMIGMVGNSSAPSIPHLHVHATVGGVTGDPVPMLHEGIFSSVNQFAVRNKIFIPQR